MKKHFSKYLLISAILTLCIALSGCSGDNKQEGSTSSDSPKYGGAVVVGVQQDVDSLDPHKAVAAGTKEILFNIFEGLVKPDENGNLINAVASDYKVSDDYLTYTFTLREGVKFHNGNLVTAEDVKYSLERAAGLISAMKNISSVNIVDQKTVEVVMKAADTEMIYNFTAAIIPKSEENSTESKPIGTGPFKFESYTPQASIVVSKNENYWQQGVPYLDQVTFKIIASADTALVELKAGSIDIYPYMTDSQANELAATHNVAYEASNVVQALFLNNKVAPLDNVKVRQALNYAINRAELNSFVSGGRATNVYSAMLPKLSSYFKDCSSMYPYDVEKAKQLLSEAGYPNGFDLTITVPSNYAFHVQSTEVMVEQLKKIGVNAKINPVEWNTWLEKAYNGREYQATVCGITSDLSPNYLLNRFQSTSSKNFVNFSSSDYDSIYKKIEKTTNITEKQEYYKQLQEILAKDGCSVFTQIAPIIVAMDKKIGGYKFYPVYVQDMSCVYVK